MNTSNTTVTLAQVQLKQVIEQLEQLLFCDLVMTYNDMAEAFSYDIIYDNDEGTLNELFSTPYDAIRQTNHDGYNDNDDYFVFNGYGHAVSFSYQLVQDDNCPIDIEELAQWIVDNELFNDYDIEVTTLGDILASIEDNITDDSVMLNKLGSFLMVDLDNDSYEDNVFDVMTELNNYSYEQTQEIVTMLGINYE